MSKILYWLPRPCFWLFAAILWALSLPFVAIVAFLVLCIGSPIIGIWLACEVAVKTAGGLSPRLWFSTERDAAK